MEVNRKSGGHMIENEHPSSFRIRTQQFNRTVSHEQWETVRDAYEEPTPGYSSYDLAQDNAACATAPFPIRKGLTLDTRVQAYQPLYTPDQAIRETPDALTAKYTFRTQAERDIVDHSLPGAGPLRVPHLNLNDNTPRHLRLEVIARRTGKAISQSLMQIRDFLKALDADEKVANEFFALLRRGEDTTNEQKWERHRWRSLWKAFQAGELETLSPDPPRLQWPAEPEPPARWLTWDEGQAFMQEWKAWKEGLDNHDPVVEEEPDGARIDGDLYKYHPVPNENATTDWLSAQPQWYRALIQFLKVADYQQVRDLSKLAYQNTWASYLKLAEKEGLTDRERTLLRFLVNDRTRPEHANSDGQLRWRFKINQASLDKTRQFMADHLPPFKGGQADVFWSLLKIRKAHHQPVLNNAGRQVSNRIQSATSMPQLKWLGAKMVQLQRGEIGNPRCFPTNREWEVLWDTWHARRKQLTQKISSPTDKSEQDGSEQRA